LKVLAETDKTEALHIHENQFGYKGLHLDARLNHERASLLEYKRFSEIPFEIQVRSIVQDAWSEVDHRLKYKKRIPKNLKRRINRLAALFELADQEFEAIRDHTSDLEEEGEKKVSNAQSADDPLTPFNFGPALREYFPEEEFEPYKVDGFVDELLEQNETMSVGDLSSALRQQLPKVQEYKNYLSKPPLDHSMNEFTQIRHALYLQNKVLYLNLMRIGPMKNLDRWIDHGTVHPAEVGMHKKHLKKK
jgi:GTP pyrophosphokinase